MPNNIFNKLSLGLIFAGYFVFMLISVISANTVATLEYSPSDTTSGDVSATISFDQTGITITNNEGSDSYVFTANNDFTFMYANGSGVTGSTIATVDWIDKEAPVANIAYSPDSSTTGEVEANITFDETATITNNSGSNTYIFTGNGSFTFVFMDEVGNQGSEIATVDWIGTGETNTGTTETNTGSTNTGSTNTGLVISGAITYTPDSQTTGSVTATITGFNEPITGLNTDTHTFTGNGSFDFIFQSLSGDSFSQTAMVDWIIINTGSTNTGSTTNDTTTSSGGGGGGSNDNSTNEDDNENDEDEDNAIPICTKSRLTCENGIYQKRVGISCQDGYVGAKCGEKSTIKELDLDVYKEKLTTSKFDPELTTAYLYAHKINITTIDSIDKANLQGALIRAHLAKMISTYAIKILDLEPDTDKECIFTDTQNLSTELQGYTTLACQLGIMGVQADGSPANQFNPNQTVDRATFGTTLSRVLRGDKYNDGNTRYQDHLDTLYKKDIISNKTPSNQELRGYVMLMMMRADKNIVNSDYADYVPTIEISKKTIPVSTNLSKNINQETQSPTTDIASSVASSPIPNNITTTLHFLPEVKTDYQFYWGHRINERSEDIYYLQHLLKTKGFYDGEIHGKNTLSTIEALTAYQINLGIINTENDLGAGYLGPTTRNTLNQILPTVLN